MRNRSNENRQGIENPFMFKIYQIIHSPSFHKGTILLQKHLNFEVFLIVLIEDVIFHLLNNQFLLHQTEHVQLGHLLFQIIHMHTDYFYNHLHSTHF